MSEIPGIDLRAVQPATPSPVTLSEITVENGKTVITAKYPGTSADISKLLAQTAQKASRDKQTYVDKLEEAEGDDVFKYILLIDVANLEQCTAQARLQAQQSFRLSVCALIAGLGMLATGVGLGFYANLRGGATPDVAYLSSVAGLLMQFVSGLFFCFYNRTLQQVNRFHDKLADMVRLPLAFLAASRISNGTQQDAAKFQVAQTILNMQTRADTGVGNGQEGTGVGNGQEGTGVLPPENGTTAQKGTKAAKAQRRTRRK